MTISCHVSPGNSGGPVIDHFGRCLGMVTETKSAEYLSLGDENEKYLSSYHMAIPSDVIQTFVERQLTSR